MELAVALGATAAWGQPFATRSSVPWHERRDLYPEGVASGDPDSDSVMLWTRRRPKDKSAVDKLHVEVAEDMRDSMPVPAPAITALPTSSTVKSMT